MPVVTAVFSNGLFRRLILTDGLAKGKDSVRIMKILILHSELGVLRGGGETVTRNLFSALAKRGHRIAAAFVTDRTGNYPIPLPPNIHPMPIRGWWSRQFGQVALAALGRLLAHEGSFRRKWDYVQDAISWRTIRWHNRRFRQRVEQEFKNHWTDFDVVYVHGDALLASKVARYRPTVLRLPGPVTTDLEPTLRAVHAVCANGDALVRIRAFLGDHAIELPIGMDSELFCPGPSSVRSALKWTDKHKVFGYVGRLTRLKGVDLLVTAFCQIRVNLPNARLLIIGKGEMGKTLQSILAEELSQQIVHIEPDLGHAQLPDWYRAMDFLVLPSRYENFSNALLEAIGCGIPVLASDVGGNGILARRAGSLFEASSVASLSACLRAADQETVSMKTRAQGLSRYVRDHYDWSASARSLESIIASRLGPIQ
jgi:glycosyltransferase involved in cell wall biosynthesis